MEADRKLRLRYDPAAQQWTGAAKMVTGHLPNRLRRLPHTFQSHALSDRIHRHEPQLIHTNRFDTVLRVGRKIVRPHQDTKVVSAPGKTFLLELASQQFSCKQTNEV